MASTDLLPSRRTLLTGSIGMAAVGGCQAPSSGNSGLDAASGAAATRRAPQSGRFANAYPNPDDTGERVSPAYFLRRARVQLTRDLARTEIPPTVPLDLNRMTGRSFAVSWFGHSSLLLRVDARWVLLDPVFSDTAGPLAGLGPARLTRVPIAPERLPHVDIVLISHDHYDHLDLETVRMLARQSGGPPRFLVGQGLAGWFTQNVGVAAREFGWWETDEIEGLGVTFVPAQHNSGRGLFDRNSALWGGWVMGHAGRRFYYAGDTSFVADLFKHIRARVGPIHLAALPIGAYEPRRLMRFDHMNPADAVDAHRILQAKRSFGVHWGTFQLGDEEPFAPARDLAEATNSGQVATFGLLSVGSILDIDDLGSDGGPLTPPARLKITTAG